ncbi:MAG TPA: acyltransferase family protein [Candidatus Nanopelagicales bacterium]|nr:acyltransferase family protein [Candidatus Nanopelagicales bacterium]
MAVDSARTLAPAPARTRSLTYAPGLDGVRAIAVLAVLLFHGDVSWLQGGFLGVDIFFVLSGFLITSLLLKELRLTDRVDFRRFYLHRARRLLPALGVVLVGAAVLALTIAPDAAERLRGDIVASMFYVTNWWYVVHDLSYFEAIGRPPLLQHLWTLAIEEQFYLIWPLIAFGLFRWGGRMRVASVALIAALASTVAMTWISISTDAPGTADVSRIYFGTDTHAMGLLLGAAFAAVWRMDQLPHRIGAPAQRILTGVGVAGLVGVLAFVLLVRYDTVWLYRGGFLVLAVLTLMLIAAAVHPALRFGPALGWTPLRYLGTRSYGLYLYHWPIFLVLRPGIDVPWDGFPVLVLRLAVTLAVAELSYRFVEVPVRRGALGRLWKAWGEWRSRSGLQAWSVAATAMVTAGLVVGLLSTGLSSAPPASAVNGLGGLTSIGAEDLSTEPPLPSPDVKKTPPPDDGEGDGADPSGNGGVTKPPKKVNTRKNFPPGTGPDLTGDPVTAVGDSVLLGAHYAVERVLPEVTIDAAVSRQFGSVAARILARQKAGRLAPVLVIHTGTNGEIPADQLAALLDELSEETRVVLVNTHVPRPWGDDSNAALAAAAQKYPNVVLADWAGASDGHREYFVEDGVHLTQPGGRAYSAVIAQALGGCWKPVCPR